MSHIYPVFFMFIIHIFQLMVLLDADLVQAFLSNHKLANSTMRRPDEEPLLEVEGIYDPIEVTAIGVTAVLQTQETQSPTNHHETIRRVTTTKVQKKRPFTKCLVVIFILAILATSIIIFIPMKITGESTLNSDDILLMGNFTKFTATSTAWNSWACYYIDWKLSGSGNDQDRGVDLNYLVTNDAQYNHVHVTCSNLFDYVLGSSDESWNIAVYNTDVKTNSDNSAITSCPTPINNGLIGTMTVNLSSSTPMTALRSGDVLFSSSCNGILVRIITRPNILTGVIRYSSNVTLQDVYSTLSVPVVIIPVSSMANNSVTHIAQSGSLKRYNSHMNTLPTSTQTDTSLFHRTKWNLPFSSGIATGSLYFDRIQWDSAPTITQLQYTDSSLDVLTWRVSTSLVVDSVLVVQVSESGSLLSVTIPLYSEISPPSHIPVALLDMISITSLVNMEVQLNVSALKLDSPYTATWRVSSEVASEWEITCITVSDESRSCVGRVISSEVALTTTPTGNTQYDVNTNKQASVSIDANVVLSMGLQFNNVLTVVDEVILALILTADTLTCPQMTLQISETASTDLSFLTPFVFSDYLLNVYIGGIIPVVPDVRSLCVPTAQPTRLPTQKPSYRPSVRPSFRPSSVQIVSQMPTRRPGVV